MPEDWSADRQRCREAGIPEAITYRPKWQIALELLDRAVGRGIHFEWLTFDEGYGGKPGFLRGLAARHQQFVGEIPRNFTGWLKAPRVVTRPFHRQGRGRGRQVPRLAADSPHAQRVDEMLRRREFRDQPWRRWRVKDGEKGPMIWEVKHARFFPKDEDGFPGEPLHLLVARNVLNPQEIKFFVSNAAPQTPVATLLLVGFSRWHVERCFEDQKGEVGLDHYEGRRYLGLKRHLMISAVSFLFLARMRQDLGKKNPEVTKCQVQTALGALIPCWWLDQRPSAKLLVRTAEEIRQNQHKNAEARQSHIKRTRKRLRELGIKLTEITRCRWGAT